MRTLAVIPARGGSKGLPGKNARPFLGVPLLARAVKVALETCDRLVVTTDSEALAVIALEAGAYDIRHRPAELATDDTPMLPVVQDAIRGREGDVIVLLQPTQPLRTAGQVRMAISLLTEDWDSVVTVRLVPEHYWPQRVVSIMDGVLSGYEEVSRRQDARPAYIRDGTAYVVRRDEVESGSLYGLCRPLFLEGEGNPIDTLEDFERLEALARRSHGEEKAQAPAEAGVLAPPRWW